MFLPDVEECCLPIVGWRISVRASTQFEKLFPIRDTGKSDFGAGEAAPGAGQHADQHGIAAEFMVEVVKRVGQAEAAR